jgi:hypothetical protein
MWEKPTNSSFVCHHPLPKWQGYTASNRNALLEDYMAILPRHKMGVHFIYHMYEHLEELEGDYVADNREDEKNYGNTW